ncbi:type IV toxin-antitoxin system AbiEi family antitoxin domain-containing protein [Frankia sp. AgPm24]|uniref:type IV toxin-antitoxin system AbiEi family antitoxin domain-containing protein n=1 Tax=Frankia sp. AgPm24 TaxID=631128 RepID=UPI00200E6493|nr:type IV toxin-antitoxin system AbiEi family antitoxin domain-containing protein [Frankia sp. AgPm24]MCK9920922.1 type IV toxin-antitoxin system AbiEi family antitoxin domain-containing protein [Frankia sp. AgPm24]
MAHNPGRLSWQEIATIQAGVITVRDAVAAGVPRTEIRQHVADGRWRQPYRGVLITELTAVGDMQRLWAATEAVGRDGVLAGAAAASLAGLAGHADEPVTILVPTARRITAPPGIVVRHSARLEQADLDGWRLPRRTGPSRSVIDMVEWAPSQAAAVSILGAAVSQEVVTLRGLRDALARRGPITRRTLIAETLDALEVDAPRLAEAMFRRLEQHHRLPVARYLTDGPPDEPTSQLRVCFDPWPVQAEVVPILGPPCTVDDSAGHLVVRLPTRMLRETPEQAVTFVTGALRRRGWVSAVPAQAAALAS